MATSAWKRRRLSSPHGRGEDDSDLVSPEEASTDHEPQDFYAQDKGSETKTAFQSIDPKSRSIHPHAAIPFARAAYDSSMWKLQVDELLIRLRKDCDNRAVQIDHTLCKLKTVIERIPGHKATTISEAERNLQGSGISVPFPEPRPGKETKYTLAFAKPTDINVVGSYARKTAIHAQDGLPVDLAVTMPSSIFQDKDYLNYRYFHKRAYYLACLASGIQAVDDLDCSITYSYQNDNPLQPIILMSPKLADRKSSSAKSSFCIRIILAVNEGLFPAAKTLPSKNCVRSQRSGESTASATGSPSPFYNATLRSECCTLASLKLLHATSTEVEAFGDVCRLGAVWLHQRGLSSNLGDGGFGQFEWASLLALLLQGGGANGKPVLSKGYSSLQLFKATLQFLAARDLVKNHLLVRSVHSDIGECPGPVFFDGQRGLDVLFKMTQWSFGMLRNEARITLQGLMSPLVDRFELAFISKVDFALQRFDCILRLRVPRAWQPPKGTESSDRIQAFRHYACEILTKGLGDRVRLMYPWSAKRNSCSISSSAPQKGKHSVVSIGLLLTSEHAFRTIDRGPSTEDKSEAAAFRDFWGEKAELRRFGDGSIMETLIWSQATESSVLEQIITFVLRRHIGPETAESLSIAQRLFDGFVSDPVPPQASPPILGAFEKLEKDIRALEGLPLQIRQVNAAGTESRYASVACSPNTSLLQRPKRLPPADVCVQFEGSTRWPNDMAAVQRTKIAFLLKMAELLESNTEGLTARLGLENEKQKLLNNAFLDIIYPNGAALRVRIHHERELNMLESLLKDRTTEVGRREDVAFAVATYKRTFVHSPAHTQAVRTLCTRHPLLSPSMRLIKQWRDSHRLSGHIPDELIELLTIRTFVTPYPYEAPGSLTAAVLRTLGFISKWDWHNDPLIVDFSGTTATKDVDAIRLRFEGWRKIDPAMNRVAMFAASDIDREGITWTEHNPSKMVAARFTALAQAAYTLAKDQGPDLQAEALFVPSMAEYDFVCHLNAKFARGNQGFEKKKKPAFKNLQLDDRRDTSLVGYDPVESYLEELRGLYGSTVLFFHEPGSSVIAGLWNPQAGPRPWKANFPYSTVPVTERGEEKISINRDATLKDVARLGGDLIVKINAK